MDRDEHVNIFHVDSDLLDCVDRPFAIAMVGRRGALTVSNSSGGKSVLLITCTHAPESTIDSLSSGLTFEGATTYSNFGLKNVASFSKYVPRMFWPIANLHFLAPANAHNVLFGSLPANVGALGFR